MSGRKISIQAEKIGKPLLPQQANGAKKPESARKASLQPSETRNSFARPNSKARVNSTLSPVSTFSVKHIVFTKETKSVDRSNVGNNSVCTSRLNVNGLNSPNANYDNEENTKSVLDPIKSPEKNEKKKVNLQVMTKIEKQISLIHNNLCHDKLTIEDIQNYYDIITKDSLENIEYLFKNTSFQGAVHCAILLEKAAIALLDYCLIEEIIMKPDIKSLVLCMSHLLGQNVLILMAMILGKLNDFSFDTTDLSDFKNIVEMKAMKKTSIEGYAKQLDSHICLTKGVIFKCLENDEQDPVKHFHLILKQTETLEIKLGQYIILKSLKDFKTKKNLMKKAQGTSNQDNQLFQSTNGNGNNSMIVPAVPFLPPLPPNAVSMTYTLVLDLDETLVHFNDKIGNTGQLFVRPYCNEFLQTLSHHYEIVIFTAAEQDYADWAIDCIDPCRKIPHRLYRQHATRNGDANIKDLSKLGRDLSRLIIVDNVAQNYSLHPTNGIVVSTWTGDPNDRILQTLGFFLIEIATKNIPDVRMILSRIPKLDYHK